MIEHDDHAAFYADTPWTWRDRLRWKLFPSKLCPLPDADPRYEDVLVVTTMVRLSWPDRLRVLVTGWMLVETRTVTEHRVGGNVTGSVAYPTLAPEPRQ